MVLKCFPQPNFYKIVIQKKDLIHYKKNRKIDFFHTINQLSKGQADTCNRALKFINKDDPLIILSCDMGLIVNNDNLNILNNNVETEIFVFVSKIDLTSELNYSQLSWISLNKTKENIITLFYHNVILL